MTFESFKQSEQGPAEVRQFVFQKLQLRGGWRGTGACAKYFGSVGDEGVPTFLARNRDLTEMHSDEFSIIALGAPRREDT